MNTNRTGMRTVLAAAAAGALIMGSAAGAMAAKPTTKTDKTLYVQSVSIKGHAPLNVFDSFTEAVDPSPSTLRDITLRVSVRDKTPKYDASTALVKVELNAYSKKVSKKTDAALLTAPISTTLSPLQPGSAKWDRFEGIATVPTTAANELQALLTTNPKVYLCISAVSVSEVENTSAQVKKRTAPSKGKVVRDCVKVVSVNPAQ